MKVRYDEGLANRIGPEPCAGVCEDVGEASVGERIGQPLSRESYISRALTALSSPKATWSSTSSQVLARPSVVVDPGMCGCSLSGNREICGSADGLRAVGPRREGEEPLPPMNDAQKSESPSENFMMDYRVFGS